MVIQRERGGTLGFVLCSLRQTSPFMLPHHHPARGILYLCAGVFVFSAQDAIIKQVSGAYPLTEVVFIRSCVAGPILFFMVQREGGWRSIFATRLGTLTLRAGIMFGAYTAYYMAFPAFPLADAVALYFTVPLFVTALAAPLLGEHTPWKVWAAVVLGFCGVMVMLQPGSGLFEPAALLSLAAAALYGLAMLMARKYGSSLSAAVMAFYQNAFFLCRAGGLGAASAGCGQRGAPQRGLFGSALGHTHIAGRTADCHLRRGRIGRYAVADQRLPRGARQRGDGI